MLKSLFEHMNIKLANEVNVFAKEFKEKTKKFAKAKT